MPYRYQLARLRYQANKLPAIKAGDFDISFGGNIEFELFSFFEVCYHLKDWVKHSEKYTKGEMSDVEEFINSSKALIICANICNRLKHCQLRSPRKNEKIGLFKLSMPITVRSCPGSTTIQVSKAIIETVHGDKCCFNLADECISEWRRYFSVNGLEQEFCRDFG